MKKKILTVLFSVLLFFNVANANDFNNDIQRLDTIGTKILEKNGIKERLTFDFSPLPNQGVFPKSLDFSKYKDINLHNNRIVTIYKNDYKKMISDDEVAALLAHNIAQGVHTYKGLFKGQLFFPKDGFIVCAKLNEISYDKKAVNYLVNAGYNPVAIITAYDKVLPEWRGSFWQRHRLANKRMLTVYNEIKTKYPQYLIDNQYVNSFNYKRFLSNNSKKIPTL